MLYSEWVEAGKRNVVKSALNLLVSEGFKAPHHFYLTFRTQFPGVQIGDKLRNTYPEEMTIMINDAFWNLTVQEDFFSVDLLFDNQKCTLRIPFKSLVNFIDPSVEFALQFDWELAMPAATMSNVIFIDKFRQG